MASLSTILEFGDESPVVEKLFDGYRIVTIKKDKIEDLIKYSSEVKFVVVNTNVLNGSSVPLVKNIRMAYSGIILVFVASQDADLSKRLVESGADDILYLGDITKEKVEQSIERCSIKKRMTANLEKLASL